MTMRHLFLAVLLPLLLSFCSKPEHFEDRLETGKVLNRSNEEVSRSDDVKEITGLLESMFESIEKKDLSSMNAHIHAQKGVWIDLKAEKTAGDFAADLADPSGYVNTYYLNSDLLRQRTGEPDQKSLYDLISATERIRADYFFQADECEVRLTIEKPEKLEGESYRFNNAYFIKENGRWYLYRLF